MAKGKYIKTLVRVSMLGLVLAGCEGQSMDQVFGIGDANPPTDQVSTAPKPRPTPTPTPPPPSPTPTPASAILKRNVAFDVLRSKGMAQVYQHEIDPAVATFNEANHVKANDRSVALWLDAINRSKIKQGATGTPGPFQNPVPGVPGAVPGAAPAAAPPGAPVVPGAPAPIPTAGQVDPRLVF